MSSRMDSVSEGAATFNTDTDPNKLRSMAGATAGSGSGAFHAYRTAKRREEDRLRALDVEHKERSERAAFDAEAKARQSVVDAARAKKAAKRRCGAAALFSRRAILTRPSKRKANKALRGLKDAAAAKNDERLKAAADEAEERAAA